MKAKVKRQKVKAKREGAVSRRREAERVWITKGAKGRENRESIFAQRKSQKWTFALAFRSGGGSCLPTGAGNVLVILSLSYLWAVA
jgi:hypothetical protein